MHVLKDKIEVNEKLLKTLEYMLGIDVVKGKEDNNLNQKITIHDRNFPPEINDTSKVTFSDNDKYPDFIENLYTRTNMFDQPFIDGIKEDIEILRSGNDIETVYERLITKLNNNNSITTLGTCDYVTKMSQFGLGNIACMFADFSAFLNNPELSDQYSQYVDKIVNEIK